MTNVTEHYARHLAPIYLWMAGGSEAALRAGAAEIEQLNLSLTGGVTVVDLGAGFGMHSIPLARTGAQVIAIDTSAMLLRTLKELAGDLPVEAVEADLLAFPGHITQKPAAILCMGDTLTHLPDRGCVDSLIARVAAALLPGGVFVVSFRDYSVPMRDDQRFIPVRSDDDRILICFLEYEPDTVVVHDIVHERTAEGWQTRVSHYRKLRLSPQELIASCESNGFIVRREAGMRGMVRLVAHSGK